VEPYPLRMSPGEDLRRALEMAVAARACAAAFVIGGIGSLAVTRMRFAGAAEPFTLEGPLEILTLVGTIATNGSHLHMSVSDARGRVQGGHVASGCTVRTTAEVLLLLLRDWSFSRERDSATGYGELMVRAKGPGPDPP
jgi:hypothetical protein